MKTRKKKTLAEPTTVAGPSVCPSCNTVHKAGLPASRLLAERRWAIRLVLNGVRSVDRPRLFAEINEMAWRLCPSLELVLCEACTERAIISERPIEVQETMAKAA